MSKYNPFIPKVKANVVIIDGRVDKQIILKLKKLNLKIIPTIECEQIHKAVSYHPDMVIHPINHNTLIVAPNVFEYYEEIFYGTNIKLIKGEKELNRNYPNDIAYNVARVFGYAIHNFKYTDEKLVFYLKKEGVDFININQGYSKCSIAIIDEKAVITSDYPIYKKMKNIGIDSLLIKPGYINLKGFNYGFIGGCCGNLSKKDIVFSGEICFHPDKNDIYMFLKKYKKNVFILNNNKMVDIGTVISLYCK